MYSIGRSATPIRVQQFWDAIDQCSSQSPVSLEQIMTVVKSVHKVSRDEVNRELEAAVRDKLIVADVVQNEKQEVTTLYKLPEQKMIKPDQHDWYCFYCHLGAGPVVGCKNCPRIFHLDCLLDDQKPDGGLFICPPCHIIATKPSAELLNLERKQLNKLLEYCSRRYKNWDNTPQLNSADGKTWAIASSRKSKDKWRYDLLVYFNIDLSQILEKAVGNKYKSLEEFQVDCETLIHGVSVYFGVRQPKGQDIAAFLHEEVTHDIQEIKLCHECVLHYYEKEKFGRWWFCHPCATPHKIVWAKLSGHPYWPAKLMKNDGSKYEVIFFGGNHEWGVIDIKNIQPIETPLSSLKIQTKTAAWNKAYEELEKFLEMAKNPEKIHSSPVKKLIIPINPAKSKGTSKKRTASFYIEEEEEEVVTKKSKRGKRQSYRGKEEAEPNIINKNSYKLRGKGPLLSMYSPPVIDLSSDDDYEDGTFEGIFQPDIYEIKINTIDSPLLQKQPSPCHSELSSPPKSSSTTQVPKKILTPTIELQEEERDELEKKVKDLTAQLLESQNETRSIKQQYEIAKSNLEEYKDFAEVFGEQLNSTNNDSSDENFPDDLTQSLAGKDDDADIILGIQSKLDAVEKENATLKEEKETIQRQAEDKIKSMMEENNRMKSELQIVNSKLESLMDENCTLKSDTKDKYERELSLHAPDPDGKTRNEMQLELDQLKTKIDSLTADAALFEESHKTRTAELIMLQIERDNLQEQFNNQQQEVAPLNQQIQTLQQSLTAQLASNCQYLAEKRVQLDETRRLNEQNTKFMQDLEGLQTENNTLKTSQVEQADQLVELRKDLERTGEEHKLIKKIAKKYKKLYEDLVKK